MAVFRTSFLSLLVLGFLLTLVSAGSRNETSAFFQQALDAVKSLPGQPAVSFRHYAGYVRLREQDEKALFYWFFEAQDKVAERPLVLWLNGGPGCSSVGYGALQELGPFLIHTEKTLKFNTHSWNGAANLLFLEAPVGVGYSYTNNSDDLHNLGDHITAQDSHSFLLNWFKRFPQFKSSEFFITGESYAGHYIPQLAEMIYDWNKGASTDSVINLKGFMIGNPTLNRATDKKGFVDYAWNHGIISDRVHQIALRNLKNLKKCDFKKVNVTESCRRPLIHVYKAYESIELYGIYEPLCSMDLTSTTVVSPSPSAAVSPFPSAAVSHSPRELPRWLPSNFDACKHHKAEKFLNRRDVQWALHANITRLQYPYKLCSEEMPKAWNDSPDTILPVIEKLLKGGLRIWIFSGDTDGEVPVTSTRYSIGEMKMEVEEEWRAWYYGQLVGGWVETYKGGLTFATLRGAGHQTPQLAPGQAFELFSHFLVGKSLPSTRYV